MKLLKLHVENFGKLQNYDLDLKDGLQVLCFENGWGKSTLAVFIKAMLFGLPATTKRSLDENERKKYMPWQGGAFGGSLDFSSQKGTFRIERFFGAKESSDSFALLDLATNRPSHVYSSAVGAELFGINADGFERSTYLSQAIFNTKGGNEEISAKLGNLLEDVDDIGSIEVARELLERRKKYYATTGNRGEIARLEEEIAAVSRELEGLARKEEARDAQFGELEELKKQLHAIEDQLSITRQGLQRAGQAREQNALLERKNSMLRELGELSAQKTALKNYFNGFPPSAQELEHHVMLHEKLKESRTRLAAIPVEPSQPAERARIRREYPNGMPRGARLEETIREHEELRRVESRLEVLQGLSRGDAINDKFAGGIPGREEIQRNQEGWKRATACRREVEELQREKESLSTSSPLLTVGILVAVLGIAALISSFLPALSVAMLPLRICGGILAASGAVISALGFLQSKKKKDAFAAAAQRITALEQEESDLLHSVYALLTTYSMSKEDPASSLAALSLLAEQCRERESNHRSVMAEAQGLRARRGALAAHLAEFMTAYFARPVSLEEYRDALDRMSRDRDLWQRLDTEEKQRKFGIAAEEATIGDLKAQLALFLRRYDPKGVVPIGECLDTLAQKREEYNRICRELTRRENELKAFIREKKLDDMVPVTDEDAEALRAAETRLLKEKDALEKKKLVLTSGIDRMTDETDRIPELEENLARLRDHHGAAKANHATITHALQFLQTSEDALSTRYLGAMQESFYRYLTMLMGEGVPDALMDNQFNIRLQGAGQARTMESFSRGWRDAVQFCVRLSLSEALYAEGETPFLMLDDPFVNLDDTRFRAARKMLDALAKKYQILYFACRKDPK